MSFLQEFILNAQQDVIQRVHELIEEKQIERRIYDEANDYAQQIVDHMYDDTREEPEPIEGIDISAEVDRVMYLLVLDYLESTGLKFAPSVFRYESRNPNQLCDRFKLAKKLHLRGYCKLPLLVQMLQEMSKTDTPPK